MSNACSLHNTRKTRNTPNAHSNTKAGRLALSLVFCLTLCLIFAYTANVSIAGASVPPQTESDITVIGRNNTTFEVPAGTSRAQLIGMLRENYGNPTPSLTKMTLVIGRKDMNLSEAERKPLTPRQINFNHKADAVLTASRQPNSRVNANEAILRGLKASAVDNIIEKYRRETRKAPKDARYAFNSRSKRLDVRTGKEGRVAPRPKIRRAIHDAMVQFATQGYRGKVTTRNVSRSITIESDAATRRQLGKIILVVRSERKLFLYDKGKLVSEYRVAVGRPGNATPKGDFVIGLKRRNPSWNNPGSSWARNMPKRIGPGPNNPLGVRALNLDRKNGSPTLLRIHGTANTGSIGQAASSGCIRLTNKNIKKLFDQVPSGTRVWIR